MKKHFRHTVGRREVLRRLVTTTAASAALPALAREVVSLRSSPDEATAHTSGYGTVRIIVEHDYDPISDAVVSWRLRPGEIVGQSFTIPTGTTRLNGFRVKLMRQGEVPQLEYRVGRVWGDTEIASGRLRPDDVASFYEQWCGADFGEPRPCIPGNRYYIQLRAIPGRNSGYYEVFGTAVGQLPKEALPRFQYESSNSIFGEFENPANVDYGERTPKYRGGSAVGSDGGQLGSMDFAFQVLGEKPVDQLGLDRERGVSCEPRFTFVNEVSGPLHERRVHERHTRAGRGEFEITFQWRLIYRSRCGKVAETAVADFQKFLRTGMGVQIEMYPIAGFESVDKYVHAIIAGTRRELPEFGQNLSRTEGFRVDASPERVVVCGFDERGLMRGLQYLEDVMGFRRAPILERFTEDREPLYASRITCTPYYSKSELDALTDPLTDGLLSRISHYGFSAIWIWGDIDKVGQSSVYPELDHGVERRQERLNEIVTRARRNGLDVYVYLANRPLIASFFANHLGAQGSALNFYHGDNVLCTSVPEVKQFMRESTQNLMKKVPGLAGTVSIIGHEGFLHCYSRYDSSNCPCPRCSQRSPQDVVAELAATIQEGVRAGRADADVVVWLYGASAYWSKDDMNQSKLIDKLPRGLTFLSEFGKEGTIRFGNVSVPAYDYPISYLGPSERFVKQAELTSRRGLSFWVKTEHAIALEFVETPYIPVFFRWAERFRRIRQFTQVSGIFANWMHYGFMPTIAPEIFHWNTWSNPPDPEQLLRRIARRDFGPGTEDHAIRAWGAFSDAIQHYPFSGPMAMGVIQKGPAHPLFFDPTYQPRCSDGRQFRNDLSWTDPWGPELALNQLSQLEAGWRSGVEEWQKVVAASPPDLRANARREGGVAQALLFCIRSATNLCRFYSVRERVWKEAARDKGSLLLDDLTSIARAELKNSEQALEVVCGDSRIGYANAGGGDQSGVGRGGIYSYGSVQKKIRQVGRLMQKEIPDYRLRRGWS